MSRQIPDTTQVSLTEEPFGLAARTKMLAAVRLFELGRLSSGRAAELAGISRLEFLTRLNEYNVGIFEHMSAEDIRQDFLSA